MVRWSEDENPLSEMYMSEENTVTGPVRGILHSSGIDTLVGPSSGWPRIRVTCMAGFVFSDGLINGPGGDVRSNNRLTTCNRWRIALPSLWVYGR